jgi:hypothetical protein
MIATSLGGISSTPEALSPDARNVTDAPYLTVSATRD